MPAYSWSMIRKLVESAQPRGIPRNSIKLYEHRGFENKGRIRIITVTENSPQAFHSLHVLDFKDCLSSMKWNLDDGISVVFTEDHDGGGRRYQIWGQGQDSDTHDNGFKDCASAWLWYRFDGGIPNP